VSRRPPTKSSADALATPDALADTLVGGDRRALARAITLIESTRSDHRQDAAVLLDRLLPHTGNSIRLGISGIPGVGKSMFVEALGLAVIGRGHRVAVLAIDPSSPRSGGSILGDKTRMEGLSRRPEAFIRPSPSGGTVGGVARRTREAVLACEAAGFDVIIVETVGVGQTETAVADLVDMFVLLMAPGTGDVLQGIKKGIVELADMIVVNKDDGEMAAAAERARHDFAAALHLLRPASPDWVPPVTKCSALTGSGIEAVWETVERYRETLGKSGALARRRAGQARAWMWREVNDAVFERLRADADVHQRVSELEARVGAGETTPAEAAQAILDAFLGSTGTKRG
jgi:LAO/AO transport system kinase